LAADGQPPAFADGQADPLAAFADPQSVPLA
jgi:hypothetical protein